MGRRIREGVFGFFFSGLQTRNLLFFTLRSFIRVSFKHGKCNGLGWEYMDWRYSFLSIDFFRYGFWNL